MIETQKRVRERVISILRNHASPAEVKSFVNGRRLRASFEEDDVDDLMSDFDVEFGIGSLTVMDMKLDELVSYIIKHNPALVPKRLEHSEMRERLVPVYLKLFGTIIGQTIIDGGRSYLFQHFVEMTEAQWDQMFKEISEAAGIEIDEQTERYILNGRFNDVVANLLFQYNQKHSPI